MGSPTPTGASVAQTACRYRSNAQSCRLLIATPALRLLLATRRFPTEAIAMISLRTLASAVQRCRCWLGQQFPGRCVLCADDTDTGTDLCSHCEQALPWNLHPCPHCALPLVDLAQNLCPACQSRPPPQRFTLAPLVYTDPVRTLIRRMKFHQGLIEARILAELLGNAVQAHPCLERPDLLVPVPLHWRRLLGRGYNQAAVLCQHLSRQLGLPWRHDLAQRLRHNPPQTGQSRRARLVNLRRTFRWRPLNGQQIALVDDVITTGATSSLLAALALRAGAGSVQVWAIARTPAHTHI